MSSQCFVLNEWLLHDLGGDNGQKAQEESFKFLERLKERCDQIAVLRDSPWMQKAYELMSNSQVRKLSQYLHLGILRDSKKCQLLDRDEIKALPEELKELVPQDDLYLFETYYFIEATTLVTTDQKLVSANQQYISIRQRDDFLKEYLR